MKHKEIFISIVIIIILIIIDQLTKLINFQKFRIRCYL